MSHSSSDSSKQQTVTQRVRSLAAAVGRWPLSARALAAAVLVAIIALGIGCIHRGPGEEPLPAFADIDDVQTMKTSFFRFLRPVVAYQNARIQERRDTLLGLSATVAEGERLGIFERYTLRGLADDYGVDWQAEDHEAVIDELLLRVDTIPEPLALAQAAKESGWGRSRFAVQGNNLFGQWCYEEGCGIVPRKRPKGRRHEVARFDSVADAVARYLHNLNTHDSYQDLRALRGAMRERGEEIDPHALAEGLVLYSQRRDAYVEEVQAMVRQFEQLEQESVES